MPQFVLRPLERDELEPVIVLHHETWHPQADVEAFRKYSLELLDTPWALANSKVMGLFVDGRLVSSFRLQRLEMLINGHKRLCAGVGTVLTLRDERGKGYASQMIRQALEQFFGNYTFCLLFSNVGPRFYKRLGFFPMPSYKYVAVKEPHDELLLGVPPSGNGNGHHGRSSDTVQAEARPMEESDLRRIVEIYNLDVSLRKIGLLRNEQYWAHLFAKERLEESLLGSGSAPRTYVCTVDEQHVSAYMTFRVLKDRLQIVESPAESFRFQSWMLHFALLLSRVEHKPKVEAQLPFRSNERGVRILVRRDSPLLMLHPLHSGLRAHDFPYPNENFLWSRDRF
jgi:GNAT superfamily N-acetyltransferase